jgi:hypothetical protein
MRQPGIAAKITELLGLVLRIGQAWLSQKRPQIKANSLKKIVIR